MTVRSFLLEHSLIEAHDMPGGSNNDEFRVICPECGNDKRKCFVNGEGRGYSCKTCPASGSWRKFQRYFEPPSVEEQCFEWFVSACEARLENHSAKEYLLHRGFTEETIRQARWGFCDTAVALQFPEVCAELGITKNNEYFLRNRITIPYIESGIIVTVRGRSLDSDAKVKYLSLPKQKTVPYYPVSKNKYTNEDPTLVVEGELSAAYLEQYGVQAIGCPGATTDISKDLHGIPNIYLAFDGDDAGRKGAAALFSKLPEAYRVELPEGYDADSYIESFGIDSFKRLINGAVLYVRGIPHKPDKFSASIDTWSDWAWSNGMRLGPSISWSPKLDEAMSGFAAPGLILMGAMAGTGKSNLISKCVLEGALEHPDALFVWISLDDSLEDSVNRIVSLQSGIEWDQTRSPKASFDNVTDLGLQRLEVLEKYNQTVDFLRGIDNIVVRDATYGRSLHYLREYFESLRIKYPERHITICIDSLSKVVPDSNDEIGSESLMYWTTYLANEIKYLTVKHKLCLFTPVDLRKVNGQIPTIDDFAHTKSLAYEASLAMTAYTDFFTDPNGTMKWYDEAGIAHPVVQLTVHKNKLGKFRGRIQYNFHEFLCDWEERTDHITPAIILRELEKKNRRY